MGSSLNRGSQRPGIQEFEELISSQKRRRITADASNNAARPATQMINTQSSAARNYSVEHNDFSSAPIASPALFNY